MPSLIQFEIVVCKLFSVLKNLKFVVWERVNMIIYLIILSGDNIINVHTFLYPCNTNVFGGVLESACVSICVSVCPSVYNTSYFVSRTSPTFFFNCIETLHIH